MKRQIAAVLRLARYREFLFFVVITTLLGASSGHGFLSWRLLVVLVANWLAVAFAFMINDVEDADDDALDPAKARRNPVSAKDLSRRTARDISWAVAGMAALLFATLGLVPFLLGMSALLLGFFYSWLPIRLKSIPLLDLLSHGLMLAGLQFLAGYATFTPQPLWIWGFPFAFVVFFSLYGELYNELRDYECDCRAGVTHTARLLGKQAAGWLMTGFFLLGSVSGILAVVISKVISPWVLAVMAILAAVLLIRPLLRVSRHASMVELQQPFQKPLEIAAAGALAIQVVVPSVTPLLHLLRP